MAKAESGQVLIIMLLMCSLLIGLIFFSVGFIKWTQIKNGTETTCRRHYLKAQSYVVKYASRLKKLNPKAIQLRMKLVVLYAKLAVLKDPINISIILFKIKKIKTKQNLLDAKQKSLIQLANYKINAETHRLKEDLKQLSYIHLEDIQSVVFPVIARPPNSTAPTYHLPSNFKNSQTVQARWNWTDQTYLKKFFNFNCIVGVKKKGARWQPALKKAKPLLNL